MTPLAKHLSVFLREYLPRDRGASPHTVNAYAQGLSLMLRFAANRLSIPPSRIALEQIDAPLVLAFLEDAEARGKASARTRNTRLAAIKAFFRFLEYRLPAALEQARQIQAIPRKKADEALVAWLTRREIRALLDAPDPRMRDGIRDRAMLHLAYACGLRVSELTGLALADYDRRDPASIRISGKGRRERILPLWKETRRALDDWLRLRNPGGDPALFHNRADRAMTRAGFEYVLAKHAATAACGTPTIAEKRVTPHVLRHSCAMHTLQATGDVRKVSLWLGHASIQSTEIYLRADPIEKLAMLAGSEMPNLRPGRFRPPDKLLAMLHETTAG
jgi:site-specific recombinase XerD